MSCHFYISTSFKKYHCLDEMMVSPVITPVIHLSFTVILVQINSKKNLLLLLSLLQNVINKTSVLLNATLLKASEYEDYI